MRIIAGEHRTRQILSPLGTTTRPITDRAKQSLFDRLVSHGLLDGGPVLDVFSGTGSLGLESLSRGMSHCTFIERDRSARERLEQNLADLRLVDRSTVLHVDALSGGWMGTLQHSPVSLAFFDPPYDLSEDETTRAQILQVMESLAAKTIPMGVAVLRTEKTVTAGAIYGWEEPSRVEVGSQAFHFYQIPEVETTEEKAAE